MASSTASRSQSSFNDGGITAVTLVLIAVSCFSFASFSCTTFEFLGERGDDDGVDRPPFAFGFWRKESTNGSCDYLDTFENADIWLKFGRIVGITGCQLGLAIAVVWGLAHNQQHYKDFVARVSYFGLIGASLLSICLLAGVRADVCKTKSGDYQCRLNLPSVAGISLVLSILMYGLAGYAISWLDVAENRRMPPEPSVRQPLTLNALNQTVSSQNDNYQAMESVSEDDHVVETIQEPDGLRLKRTTKRSVQTDGSNVLKVTTEILSLPIQAANANPADPSWSSMEVETVSKNDDSVTKTTTQTFDDPDNASRVVQRTVEITERKLRTMTSGIDNLTNLGRNGKMVEIDTIRQPDGSAITTTTTTTRKGSILFMVERVILISEKGVRTTTIMESTPAESTVLSEPSHLATRQHDVQPQEVLNEQFNEDSPGGGIEESKEDADKHNNIEESEEGVDKHDDMQSPTTKPTSPKRGGEESGEPSDDDSHV